MDLNDKANETPDVRLIGDVQFSAYRLLDTELVPGDEITPEGDFPQYGDFAKVEIPGSDAQLFVEVVQDLASQLVELGIEAGDEFRVERCRKVDGEWQVDVKAGAEKS